MSEAKSVHPFFSNPGAAAPKVSSGPVQWLPSIGGTCLHGTHLDPPYSSKVVLFDIDGTLVQPKSGMKHPVDHKDWKWWRPEVVPKLKECHRDGFSVVFLSNQGKPAGIKDEVKRKAWIEEWKQKITLMAQDIPDVPFRIFVACGRDLYRKPMLGTWWELERLFKESNTTIDKSLSCLVGDAAGRTGDHESTDRKYAINAGINFYTPEEYFLGHSAKPFTLAGFHPSSLPDLPLYTPANPPLIPPGDSKPPSEIVLFVGFPSSGKSTFFKRHFKPRGYVQVNQDKLKTKPACLKAVTEVLKKKGCCVVDNTNRDNKTRKDYVSLAKKYRVPIRCVWFDVSKELAFHNNIYRAFCLAPSTQSAEDKRSFLGQMIYGSFKSAFEEPQVDEGFSDIKKVNWVFEGSEEDRQRWEMWLQI
ncbi:hypothetical protein BOTBODRAFT_104942 [Botryobasidium botryosum FD-172 SS1]|uniref:Polynucleotide kinase 3'-phosphatase n=1 Tax=Botryobasidium botryosum (strain FD-172 SS1) TaxID=930990 RepID=A0A067N2W5_BOTB1|nr:hypothetical protein BOTBODRAFT_104942 [Botryobasidium botryosum FD-172 SS1]